MPVDRTVFSHVSDEGGDVLRKFRSMWEKILQDALFAAIAAIGFAAISRPPARAYVYCAAIAAIGHSIRFVLMSPDCGSPLHIVPATLIASFAVGLLAVIFSPIVRTPPETCFFPALLPMIPGMYAYRTFGAAAMCVLSASQEEFSRCFYLFASNSFTCICLLLCMAVGATLPVFMFKKISFRATRNATH